MAQTKTVCPIEIDCKNLRAARQKENNDIVFHALRTGDATLVKHLCNNAELDRVLEELDINLEELLSKCAPRTRNTELDHVLEQELGLNLEELLSKYDITSKHATDKDFAKLLAGRISKRASRQGIKDEAFVLDKCHEVLSKIGIQIDNLSTTAYRPTKDGRILNNKKYKKSGLKKNECLKSFDAQISGRLHGFIFAKITFTKGGHQDNVFIEAHEFGEWAQKYGYDYNELFVILIDTDLTTQFADLKDKFKDVNNILVCNHFEFQQYCLENAP